MAKKKKRLPHGAYAVAYLYNNGVKQRKCHVVCYTNGRKDLVSYRTIVCRLMPDGDFVRKWNSYSATTMRHVNLFRQMIGMPNLNKKSWTQMYCAI